MLYCYFKSETFVSVIISNFHRLVDITEIEALEKITGNKKHLLRLEGVLLTTQTL